MGAADSSSGAEVARPSCDKLSQDEAVRSARAGRAVFAHNQTMRRPLAVLLLCLAALAARAEPDAGAFFAATLTDLDGNPAKLALYRGRPLVVNFWARWCLPCRDELPLLAGRAAQGKPGDALLLGIALEDQAGPVRDFLRVYEIGYPQLLARDQGVRLLRTLGNSAAGLPFTAAFDRRGRLVFSRLGRLSAADLDRAYAAASQP